MRKTIKLSFEQLVLENKKELMNNEQEMKKIEQRIDDKHSKLAK
ncbi:FbpB family small basic protein [Priestia abyssalis]|nr:FbpB family small basic protein [Priestia abyssalis]